jgi:hypothetical protein
MKFNWEKSTLKSLCYLKLGAKQNAMSQFQIRVTSLFPHKMKWTYSSTIDPKEKESSTIFPDKGATCKSFKSFLTRN